MMVASEDCIPLTTLQVTCLKETTSRKTSDTDLRRMNIGPSRVEESSLSRTLAFDCGHGYAQEEYATK